VVKLNGLQNTFGVSKQRFSTLTYHEKTYLLKRVFKTPYKTNTSYQGCHVGCPLHLPVSVVFVHEKLLVFGGRLAKGAQANGQDGEQGRPHCGSKVRDQIRQHYLLV